MVVYQPAHIPRGEYMVLKAYYGRTYIDCTINVICTGETNNDDVFVSCDKPGHSMFFHVITSEINQIIQMYNKYVQKHSYLSSG